MAVSWIKVKSRKGNRRSDAEMRIHENSSRSKQRKRREKRYCDTRPMERCCRYPLQTGFLLSCAHTGRSNGFKVLQRFFKKFYLEIFIYWIPNTSGNIILPKRLMKTSSNRTGSPCKQQQERNRSKTAARLCPLAVQGDLD